MLPSRLAKVHAYIIHALRKDMPAVFGKESKKKELIKNLDQLYGQLQREHQVRPHELFPFFTVEFGASDLKSVHVN